MLIHKFLKTFSEADLGQILFGWGLDNTRDHWGLQPIIYITRYYWKLDYLAFV